jgi:SIR2-like domain
MMAGHFFIVRGDLTRLACDAWIMPTGYQIRVEDYWLKPGPDGFQDELAKMRHHLSEQWKNGDERVMPVPFWHRDKSKPWLVNIIYRRNEKHRLIEAVSAFVDRALAEGAKPTNKRERHLFALPVISTGFGGGASVKGQVISALVRDLIQLVKDKNVDIVLVTYTAPAFAAAQKARFEANFQWSALSSDLVEKARSLAKVGSQQGLALFLGAGVSCSAGLPSWNGLLDKLARQLGFAGTELEEFSKLDVLDRGSVLERRFRHRNESLNDRVAQIFEREWDYSLLHGLLACLPADETITQNYDRLFEAAAVGCGSPVATLPYTPGDVHSRWLLKMHGCVSRPDDIVIRREDYLRYSERRAALAGIVQATMLTRHMLFVGFSLRDGNFHRAVDDVRLALGENHRNRLGTALFLAPSALTSELWDSELDIVDFLDTSVHSDPDTSEAVSHAARKLEIFMDCLLGHCGSITGHLLDPTFSHLLSVPEKELKAALLELERKLSSESRSTVAFGKVRELLVSLGWPT